MTNGFNRFFSDRFASVRLDFGEGSHQKQLTLTFTFLSGLVALVTLLTALWSISVGILQSGHLIVRLGQVFGEAGVWQQIARLLAPVIGVFVYGLMSFGLAMLVWLASASIGAIVGFLFGVPRPISESGVPSQTGALSSPTGTPSSLSDTSLPPTGGEVDSIKPPTNILSRPSSGQPASPGWQASTNLTQISDWLTKIIVGVGLVEAKSVYEHFASVNTYVSAQMFGGVFGSRIAVPALIITGLFFGFIYTYLFTQLFLATLMAYSAKEVSEVGFSGKEGPAAIIAGIKTGSPILAPSLDKIDSGWLTDEPPKPTDLQTSAARSIQTVPLDQLEQPSSIQVWARAQALMNEYGPAVAGYRKLLQKVRTPEILAEAARVFSAANDFVGARSLIDQAVAGRERTSPITRARITFDAANLALYDPPPGGYSRALSLLSDSIVDSDEAGRLRVLRACARGQRYKYEANEMTTEAKARLRSDTLDDLKRSVEKNRDWLQYLIDPDSKDKSKSGPDRDDDLEVFSADPEFRSLVGLPPM